MLRTILRAATVILITCSGVSAANVLVEHSYAQKYENASLVIVGKVVRDFDPSTSRFGRVSEVQVLSTLKGRRFRLIRIYTTSQIVESDPRCCRIGTTYIMFLGRAAEGVYGSINGRHGFIAVG